MREALVLLPPFDGVAGQRRFPGFAVPRQSLGHIPGQSPNLLRTPFAPSAAGLEVGWQDEAKRGEKDKDSERNPKFHGQLH